MKLYMKSVEFLVFQSVRRFVFSPAPVATSWGGVGGFTGLRFRTHRGLNLERGQGGEGPAVGGEATVAPPAASLGEGGEGWQRRQ